MYAREGACTGGGFSHSFTSDLVFATSEIKFSISEINKTPNEVSALSRSGMWEIVVQVLKLS